MRKAFFIGCGFLLLLVVGGLAFVGYTFIPPVKALYEQFEVDQPRFSALEDSFPFDVEAESQLDVDRFTTHLELRVTLVDYARTLEEDIQRSLNDDSIGFIEQLRVPFTRALGITTHVATTFEEAHMSLSEFAWYSRVLWATLRNLDKGAGGMALAPLRGRYSELRQRWEEATRDDEDAPTIDEIIGAEQDFPPAVMDTALALVAQDTDSVLAGLAFIEAEPFFMQAHGNDPESLQDVVFPGESGSIKLDGR